MSSFNKKQEEEEEEEVDNKTTARDGMEYPSLQKQNYKTVIAKWPNPMIQLIKQIVSDMAQESGGQLHRCVKTQSGHEMMFLAMERTPGKFMHKTFLVRIYISTAFASSILGEILSDIKKMGVSDALDYANTFFGSGTTSQQSIEYRSVEFHLVDYGELFESARGEYAGVLNFEATRTELRMQNFSSNFYDVLFDIATERIMPLYVTVQNIRNNYKEFASIMRKHASKSLSNIMRGFDFSTGELDCVQISATHQTLGKSQSYLCMTAPGFSEFFEMYTTYLRKSPIYIHADSIQAIDTLFAQSMIDIRNVGVGCAIFPFPDNPKRLAFMNTRDVLYLSDSEGVDREDVQRFTKASSAFKHRDLYILDSENGSFPPYVPVPALHCVVRISPKLWPKTTPSFLGQQFGFEISAGERRSFQYTFTKVEPGDWDSVEFVLNELNAANEEHRRQNRLIHAAYLFFGTWISFRIPINNAATIYANRNFLPSREMVRLAVGSGRSVVIDAEICEFATQGNMFNVSYEIDFGTFRDYEFSNRVRPYLEATGMSQESIDTLESYSTL